MGRDKGIYFVVLNLQGDMAFIANGKEHKLDSPKAKKLKHLTMTTKNVGELPTTDKLLKKAISDLTDSLGTT